MLETENTALAVIDVQGKLSNMIHEHDLVLGNIGFLIKAALNFNIPVLWSEQAPNKIGPTIDPIKHLLAPKHHAVAKRTFSCWGAPEYIEQLKKINRKQILICGIETHVCVYQTASDLQRHGYEVFIVADAVSSRYALDKELALGRMLKEGITITSLEMAICELLKTADNPHFKDVIAYLKR